MPLPRALHRWPPAVAFAFVRRTGFVVIAGVFVVVAGALVVGAGTLVVAATVLPPLPVDGGVMPTPG
jgi:hypothetical protein